MHWMGLQPQQMKREQEGSPGQHSQGPEERATAMAWGCQPQLHRRIGKDQLLSWAHPTVFYSLIPTEQR